MLVDSPSLRSLAPFSHALGAICQTLRFTSVRRHRSSRQTLRQRHFHPFIRKILAFSVVSKESSETSRASAATATSDGDADTVADDWSVAARGGCSSLGDATFVSEESYQRLMEPVAERKILQRIPSFESETMQAHSPFFEPSFRALSPPPAHHDIRRSATVGPYDIPEDVLCSVHHCSLPCLTCFDHNDDGSSEQRLQFPF